MVQTMTGHTFEAMIAQHEIIFVDFWAAWCAPCTQFAKIFEKVSNDYETVLFVKVNIEEEQELAEAFQIRSIPHLMVFKQGIVIYSEAGNMPESTLKELVEQALRVDVSGIKAQIKE